MANWTKKQMREAGTALSWRLGTSVQREEVVFLQCEVTALREALELLLKSDRSTRLARTIQAKELLEKLNG
jgi:hypothetical protein